ncbi:MAG TPA: AAA family ATPase, partial [Longimicrobiales bacterium]|nr:AAA family ATPase [Longimicrobiales bacterium]
HPYVSEAKVVRKLRDLVAPLQATSSVVLFLSPTLELPRELEKDVSVVDYPLPTLDDIRSLFEVIEEGVASNPSLSIDLGDEDRDRLLQAALGLTENEARNVFAKALARDRTLSVKDVDVIVREKEQIVRKSGVLEYFANPEDFGAVGGLDQLKAWLSLRSGALTKKARDFGLPPPKGLLLIGVPGCGKSLTAKAAAYEWNQPLLKLDVGKLFGGLVGSSEQNIRRTIQFAEAVAPCILWIDEIEKGFAGFRSTGDSGTSARVFSTFLTWMQEKSSPVFVIATANDVTSLPPELLRKGRFDELFFVDLPFPREREEILGIHLRKRGRDPEALGIDVAGLARRAEGFSGAELEQAVIDGLYRAFDRGVELDSDAVAAALDDTYPLSETMKEPIRAMREWAEKRARYASTMWRDRTGEARATERWASIGN